MKQTYDTLRSWYLRDLEAPDIHHGRTTPKARHLDHWKKINSHYADFARFENTSTPHVGKIYCWSDIHFGHKNIIQYTGRPFSNPEQMNAAMIANYQAIVQPDDIVIFGGDITFMKTDVTNEILHSLPGYKIQIVGNHDIERKSGEPTKLHFDERHLCMVVDVDDDLQLLFTHYPLDTVPPKCINVHGHIHQHLANRHNINISVEHTEYAPRPLESIIAQAKAALE